MTWRESDAPRGIEVAIHRVDLRRVALGVAAATGFLVAAVAILPRGTIDDGGVSGGDAHAYWVAGRHVFAGTNIYDASPGEADAYLYPPVFAQALAPIAAAVPFTPFVWLLRLAAVLLLVVAAGGWRAAGIALLVFPPAIIELDTVNVHFALAAACGLAMRGRAEAIPLCLPLKLAGIGAFAHALVRHRRAFARGLLVAGGAVAISAILSPRMWLDYVGFLQSASDASYWSNIGRDLPLVLRLSLGMAAGLLAIRWVALLPVAVILTLPIVWLNSLSILVCLAPLIREWIARHPIGAQRAAAVQGLRS